ILKQIGVRNFKHLTPTCRKFYKISNLLLKQSRRNTNRNNLFKTRLRDAEKFNDKYLVSRFSPKVTAAASLFMKLQVRETKKSSRGHRFNLDEKMLSLSLYKRSPKCYRMLAKLFTLPSKRTLNNILSSVKISPGICPLMMKVLTDNVKNLKPSERYCSILFDEVCLSSGLTYDTVTDEINGFVNTGHSKTQQIDDHALVFMVRGTSIMYTFCEGATNQQEIICQLKQVIEAVHLTGLRIVATISDQGTANVGAIKILNNETRLYHVKNNSEYHDEFYEVELHDKRILKLVHIYDVPHLLKCIRNNLLTKDLEYTVDNITKYAKWSHLEDLYHMDSAIPDCKILPRLTDQHIVRDKIGKMKVKYATQVFSQRVSSTMNFLASRNIIGPDASDTAFICSFFDKLFDSLNGSFDKVTDGKIYRTAVKKNSIHHTVWADSLKILSTMSFVLDNGRKKSVPTIKNWMTTIRSFQTLSNVLGMNGIRSLLPRHLNQDPLECFFGAIRSIGSKNPNCHAFASAYKTLVLNNLVSSHSPGYNCEEDFTEGSLSSFTNFFESAIAPTSELENQIFISADLPQTLHHLSMSTSFVRGQAQNYIAGFILSSEKVAEHHLLITAREYQSNHPTLKYPSSTLCS
ncbi:THAP-type domain-containing protein, partial [Aphis craccivora]